MCIKEGEDTYGAIQDHMSKIPFIPGRDSHPTHNLYLVSADADGSNLFKSPNSLLSSLDLVQVASNDPEDYSELSQD